MSNATAGQPTPADLVGFAQTLVRNHERTARHSRSEKVPDVEGIMATVTPADQLTWSKCYAWSLMPGPDGRRIRVRTTNEEIREFYEWRTTLDVPANVAPAPLTTILADWYGFHEAHPTTMLDVNTGEVTRVVEALEIFTMDGQEGINSEIIWLRIDDVSAGVSARVAKWEAYLAGLREQDPAKIVETMSADVQGAVRDYVGAEPPFVAIHGREEMQAYYERMFARFELLELNVLQSHIGNWYVFQELFLTLREREGTDAGRTWACRIGEYLPFDSAGDFQGRCGYGTELLPL